MTLAEQFGRRVFMARRRAGLSQAALARAAGLSTDGVLKLEHGNRQPRLDTIWKLARVLEVKPSELIDGLRSPGPLP
jgi:transcriptional regulator with XRE-family HTH domain